MEWSELTWWDCGERQVIEEKLDALDEQSIMYCPSRSLLYRSLDTVRMDDVRVVVLGQDPYPEPKYATGIAFSIPKELRKFPPTLINIFTEYSNDLHYDYPKHGNLDKWCKQGVLLLNAIPICLAYRPKSCHSWLELSYLTKEIITKLSLNEDIVFVFLGNVAKEYSKYLKSTNKVIFLSHPSPLGQDKGRHPFKGSRLFSTINGLLSQPVDWRL